MANAQSNVIKLVTEQFTVSANVAAKSFVTAAGAVPSSAAKAYGVTDQDVANGDYGDFTTVGVVAVIATGTCTKGSQCEILTGTTVTKDAASVTFAGVQDATSTNVRVGKLHSAGSTGDIVLVEINSAMPTSG